MPAHAIEWTNELKMASWSKSETLKLIEFWSADDIQMQLEGCKQNQQVLQKIVSQMQNESYNRTYQQCREKIKELRKEYKKVKDKICQTGQEGRQYLITSLCILKHWIIYWVIDQ